MKDYQKSVIMRDGKVVKKDSVIENQITTEVMKIVNAVINKWHYYIFEDYDDLLQHGMMNCYKNYVKFTPGKGSALIFLLR